MLFRSERDMSAIQASVPQNRFVQQIHGTGEIRCGAVCHLRKEMSVGEMHGHKFSRQHPVTRVPQPTDTHAQGVQGNSATRQMLVGLVLRIQAASDMQRQWRTEIDV